MSMKTIIINGLALSFAKSITGIQRACKELIYRLDKLIENTELNVKYVYDADESNIIIKPHELKNIVTVPLHIKHFKSLKRKFILRRVAKVDNAIICNLSLDTVFSKNQISFIYDVRACTTKFDTFKFRFKAKIYMLVQKLFTKVILTDSYFQKNEIRKYMKINPERIFTIYMGHEHMFNIIPDTNIYSKFSFLKKGCYFYALGSLAPHKNFKWIIEVAKRNPNEKFVIAGGKDLNIWRNNIEVKNIPNLLFLGYVTNEENKALMIGCKAFIHPSKYEGFGIPPLEAMTVNSKILVSNATCLPEIYEDSVKYFDPDDYDINLNELLDNYNIDYSRILDKCSWNKSANQLLDILLKYAKQ